MPMISVSMLPGRTDEQKSALVRELTDALVRTCDAKPESVWVTITEVPAEHWGIGGTLVSQR